MTKKRKSLRERAEEYAVKTSSIKGEAEAWLAGYRAAQRDAKARLKIRRDPKNFKPRECRVVT